MNYQLRNLDCQFSLENQKLDLQKLFMRDARGELFATGNWNLATGEKNFQVRSGLDPAKLLANDPRFPWAKELKFDAPPEIELSGVARPDGHLQVLGKLNFDQFSFRNVKFQSMKAEFSKSGDSWMVMNAQVTHRSGTLIRRCVESSRRLSDADQLRVESDRADAALPAEISTGLGRLGISDVAGDPGHVFRHNPGIRQDLGERTNLVRKNKISRRTPELCFSKLRSPEQCRSVRPGPRDQG